MIQTGVAVLEKDLPFPADCALSWIIWVALSPSIVPCWTTRLNSVIAARLFGTPFSFDVYTDLSQERGWQNTTSRYDDRVVPNLFGFVTDRDTD